MKRGTYTQRRTFIVTDDPTKQQPVLSVSLPKNCTEIRFFIESGSTKVTFGYSFDPFFNRPTIIPNTINGAIAENFDWNSMLYSGMTGIETKQATKQIIIRKTEDMPNTMYVFVSGTSANSQCVLNYQIVGGSNNGY
jgi:hypothetical protein